MVNTCSVTYCKTGYKQKGQVAEYHPVFEFPDTKSSLKEKWIHFVNCKHQTPTKSSGICAKHFEEKYLKQGLRTTLRWDLNLIPSIYSNTDFIPPSVLPTPKTSRKLPSVRKRLIPDEKEVFDKNNEIKTFSELTDKLCPFEYKLDLDEEKARFYKTEYHATYNIPQITETVTVGKFFHVKLFLNSSPVLLPEWFRKGSDCRLKRKSMLQTLFL